MVCLNRKGLSSAIVVILLAAAGIVVATVAIRFLHGAALSVNQTATMKLNESLELLNSL